jgi:tetratricopeptide (TPR) repeat protein
VTPRLRLAGGTAALMVLVLSMNVFGQELNALFLRYPGIDKALHVLGYMTAYAAIYWLAGNLTHDGDARARWAAVLTLALSAADESFQALMPARSLEAFDVVANVAGVVLGWAIVRRTADGLALTAATVAVCAGVYVGWETHVRLYDYARAIRYEQQQDFVRARHHFRLALDNGLRTAGLFNELGWVEIESGIGDPHEAVEYAKTALDMQPGNYDILDTYGWALHHAGRTREAIDVLERVYAARPNMFCINYHLGSAYLAAGDRDKAEFHFARQVERKGTREAVFARQALDRMGSNQ